MSAFLRLQPIDPLMPRDLVRRAAYDLTRATLSLAAPHVAPADWRFERDSRGKPFVAGADAPRFSLTHCRLAAACAVCLTCDVGVDAEPLDRRVVPLPLALARRFFTAKEADALAQIADEDDRRRAFLRLWTLKEAVAKATGSGLAQSLQGFSFSLNDPPVIEWAEPSGEDWSFRRLDAAGCSVALALRGALAQKIDIDFQIAEPQT
jgi:4'-phosphopantetheinyl transferase